MTGCPDFTLEQIFCLKLFAPRRASMHEDADQSIGNDFFDFGGGNSRSRSVRCSFVNLISIERALSNLDFYFWPNFFQAAAAKAEWNYRLDIRHRPT
jgi:hypothetical protein